MPRGLDTQVRQKTGIAVPSRDRGRISPVYYEAYYAGNRERILARNREWRRANPGWYRKHGRHNMTYRALAVGLLRARDRGICWVCNSEVPFGLESIDHVVPVAAGGGHEPSNVRLAHRRCNAKRPRARRKAH